MADRIDRRRLFTGCVVSLVATAFGFAVRAAVLEDWRGDFNLSQEQIGYLLGAGLFPFAISIILFSLISTSSATVCRWRLRSHCTWCRRS